MHKFTTGTGQEIFVHDPEKCAGYPCCIHNPSEHVLSGAPLHWRGDRGLMERICLHEYGHPDPDDMAHKRRVLGRDAWSCGVHGCDGCCK